MAFNILLTVKLLYKGWIEWRRKIIYLHKLQLRLN